MERRANVKDIARLREIQQWLEDECPHALGDSRICDVCKQDVLEVIAAHQCCLDDDEAWAEKFKRQNERLLSDLAQVRRDRNGFEVRLREERQRRERADHMPRRDNVSDIAAEHPELKAHDFDQLVKQLRQHSCQCGSGGAMACDDDCPGDMRDRDLVEAVQTLLLVVRDLVVKP